MCAGPPLVGSPRCHFPFFPSVTRTRLPSAGCEDSKDYHSSRQRLQYCTVSYGMRDYIVPRTGIRQSENSSIR